mmetsp:Transcript_7326/g.22336  ORF Transcript_7326/g.22336 Transcript_7326/m.22336 type:complete len:269 (-) Transcript_7326:509-1315(-)
MVSFAVRDSLSFVADVVAAGAAAVLVAPVVAATDRAIAESSSGRSRLWPSFFESMWQTVRNPVSAVVRPEFRIIWALYAGTYAANNACCTVEAKTATSAPTTKTAVIFACNTSLSLWKDSAFARLFGVRSATSVPAAAYLYWAIRDVTGMAVVFTAPPLVAPYLSQLAHSSSRTAEVAAQLVLPLAVQPVVAPFHFAGYDVFNRPHASLLDRLNATRIHFPGVVVMRWIRGFPPYCLGAVANKTFRASLHDAVDAALAADEVIPVNMT